MHANAIANGVVVSFPSKMLMHRKIAPAAIKPKLAMMNSLFSISFISFSPSDFFAFYQPQLKIMVSILTMSLPSAFPGIVFRKTSTQPL